MEVALFPGPSEENNSQLERAATQLQTLLQEAAATIGVELTRTRQRLYLAALLPYPPDRVQIGLIRLLRKWTLSSFPQIGEIIQEIHEADEPEKTRRAECASEELAARYKAARRDRALPKSPFRSVREHLVVSPLNRQLTRHEELMLGLAEPRRLSPIEQEARIAELRAQAAQLQPREHQYESGEVGAGLTSGLV